MPATRASCDAAREGVASHHGRRCCHAHCSGSARRSRRADLLAEPGALARGRDHEARARGVPRRGRRRVHRGERRPPGVAPAVPRRRRRRAVLLEEPAEGRARVGPSGDGDVPEREEASAARARRAGRRGVGRADEHDRVPPVAIAHRRHRQPRPVAHRPRPAARHRLRRGRSRRARPARASSPRWGSPGS